MTKIDGKYRFGAFQLDAREHRLLHDGVEVPLQPKAFDILCVLVRHAGRLLTKEELLSEVWPDSVVEENNLNKNISLLRKILSEDGKGQSCDGKGQSCIETVPRVGYRFTGNVTLQETSAPAPTTNGHAARGPRPEKSVAVVYFENLSGDKEDEYFRDGMTEDVITELAKIKGLRVFPRSCVLAFRDSPLPVTEVGQRLRAAFVLEGSIRRAGSHLRITARLAETGNGHSVWTERYDRRLEDVFTVQDEIAQSIARALRVVLSEEEKHKIEKIPTSNIQAYDCYLRGRQFFYQGRRQALEFARQMFARAIAIDPGYARAYAGMADCCSFLAKWFEGRDHNIREALAASHRAVELDPQSAEAHASLGLAEFLNENLEVACREFETALSLDSELFEAYYFYGRCCFTQGQYEKAAQLFARAGQVNPSDFQAPSLRGLCLRALNRPEEAREAFQDSVRNAERHLELHPDDVRCVSLVANDFCGMGEEARAREWAQRALDLAPDEAIVLYNIACTYALLDEADMALDCLRRAMDQGFCHRGWMENDPDLASLRDHPRFRALMGDFEAEGLSLAL